MGLGLFVSRASSSPTPLEREFQAAYPHTPEVSGSFAGIRLDALSFAGLRLLEREDLTVEAGGTTLAYGDTQVRLVIEVAIAHDSKAARGFVDMKLHGISRQLPASTDPSFGDYAFGDGDSIVVGAAQNVAWVVRSLDGSPIKARDAIAELRAKTVVGAPVFPTATITLPTDIPHAGGDVRITTTAKFKLRAEGGYVAHGKGSPILKPFKAGPVTLVATLVDDLGRVSEARATTTAK
ncbi:MAG: hypothetical protein ACXVEF_15620 [Polyangiales bacterium]